MQEHIVLHETYCDAEGEEYDILYLDGVKVMEGDYYHNHIKSKIAGYLVGLDTLITYKYVKKHIEVEDIGFIGH